MGITFKHLQELENEAIEIIFSAYRQFDNIAMLYSLGKDSSCMLHLLQKAFSPGKIPFPLVHIDTLWKFKEMIDFRDSKKREGLDLIIYSNPVGYKMDINPFTHGSEKHTEIMKTIALKQMLNEYKFDAVLCGARRDEEITRAKERVFSFRDKNHNWDPKNQRPEPWQLYNGRINKEEEVRVFPLSNWTELDVWLYIYQENIPIVPLYFAKERPVVKCNDTWIMKDDERMPQDLQNKIVMKKVRFRTLGCYPLTGACESTADTIESIIYEIMLSKVSERGGRLIDSDSSGSMEKKKRVGYF